MSNWISISEKLPRDYGPYLVCYKTPTSAPAEVRFSVFFFSPKNGWILGYIDKEDGLYATLAGEEDIILCWQKIKPPFGILSKRQDMQ